jgi:hypothetical protein
MLKHLLARELLRNVTLTIAAVLGVGLLLGVGGQAAPYDLCWGRACRVTTLTATTSSGNAVKVNTNGARVDFGAGASDYASSDGTTVTFAGPLATSGALSATTGAFSGTITSSVGSGTNALTCTTNGARVDFGAGASDYASSDGITVTFAGPLATSGAFSAGGALSATTGAFSGAVISTTPHTLFSMYPNAALAVATYGGHHLPDQAFTVTGVSFWVSSGSGGGIGNTTWRISDGSNNCDCSVACLDTTSAGAEASASCSGDCAFAAAAKLSAAVQTAGCTTTQPTALNVDVRGIWQ